MGNERATPSIPLAPIRGEGTGLRGSGSRLPCLPTAIPCSIRLYTLIFAGEIQMLLVDILFSLACLSALPQAADEVSFDVQENIVYPGVH